MVKVGFICEGKTERKIVESEKFQQFHFQIGIECVKPVFDAKGAGNLLPENLDKELIALHGKGAQKVLILTDLDEDACITVTRNRITMADNRIVVVAVKEIESWFLADSDTLTTLLRQNFFFEKPEEEITPFETLKEIFMQIQGRGVGVKKYSVLEC